MLWHPPGGVLRGASPRRSRRRRPFGCGDGGHAPTCLVPLGSCADGGVPCATALCVGGRPHCASARSVVADGPGPRSTQPVAPPGTYRRRIFSQTREIEGPRRARGTPGSVVHVASRLVHSIKEGERRMAPQADALLNPSRLWTRSEVLVRDCPVPPEPGVYAWYFREVPPGVPTADCRRAFDATLLYVGISPKRPPSGQDLRRRIRYHYCGNAEVCCPPRFRTAQAAREALRKSLDMVKEERVERARREVEDG